MLLALPLSLLHRTRSIIRGRWSGDNPHRGQQACRGACLDCATDPDQRTILLGLDLDEQIAVRGGRPDRGAHAVKARHEWQARSFPQKLVVRYYLVPVGVR